MGQRQKHRPLLVVLPLTHWNSLSIRVSNTTLKFESFKFAHAHLLTRMCMYLPIRYHIPRSFLKPKDNLLVIFEETGGKINEVQVQIVNRDTICSYITELHPPSVKSWERTQNQFKPVVEDVKSGAQLTCPEGKVISVVEFASFGDPLGVCGTYMLGTCNSPNSMKVVEQVKTEEILLQFLSTT